MDTMDFMDWMDRMQDCPAVRALLSEELHVGLLLAYMGLNLHGRLEHE